MKLQTIFNRVAKHLMTQRRKSVEPTDYPTELPQCMYRGVEGLKCAVGCLIPNKVYKKSMEGTRIDEIVSHSPTLKKLFPTWRHIELVDVLQLEHDNCEPQYWHGGLTGIAKEFDLDGSILKQFKPITKAELK